MKTKIALACVLAATAAITLTAYRSLDDKQAEEACLKEKLPEICTVMTGCGGLVNKELCLMRYRPMCTNEDWQVNLDDTRACTHAVARMSCDDEFPEVCFPEESGLNIVIK